MNHDYERNAENILKKFQSGTASKEEEQLVKDWFEKKSSSTKTEVFQDADSEQLLENIKFSISKHRQKVFRLNIWRYSAAVALVIFSIVLYTYSRYSHQPEVNNLVVQDALPASSNAFLELSDGNTIKLDSLSLGTFEMKGIDVDEKNGIISFVNSATSSTSSLDLRYNTIRTAAGGKYTVVLPDGSEVILNSESSIRFPSQFAATRNVEVEGEVYFDVKRDEQKKFLVQTKHQAIEVLGTEFNITSYKEENTTKTSLISGSLRVTSSVNGVAESAVLKPGQLAENGPSVPLKISSTKIETQQALVKGEFHFDGESLDQILRVLSRWYDVQFIYEFKPSYDVHYGGVISKNRNLSSVLKLLEDRENVEFIIRGKEVTVRKRIN